METKEFSFVWKYFIAILILSLLFGGMLSRIIGTQDKEYIFKAHIKSKSMCRSFQKKFTEMGLISECKEVDYANYAD